MELRKKKELAVGTLCICVVLLFVGFGNVFSKHQPEKFHPTPQLAVPKKESTIEQVPTFPEPTLQTKETQLSEVLPTIQLQPEPVPSPAPQVTYLVKQGDLVGALAKRFSVSVSDILKENDLKDAKSLRAGKTIRIPAPILLQKEEEKEQSSQAPEGETYLVKAGDIPATLAKRFGVSVEAILKTNNLKSPAHLRAGKSIVIPQSSNGSSNIATLPNTSSEQWPVGKFEGSKEEVASEENKPSEVATVSEQKMELLPLLPDPVKVDLGGETKDTQVEEAKIDSTPQVVEEQPVVEKTATEEVATVEKSAAVPTLMDLDSPKEEVSQVTVKEPVKEEVKEALVTKTEPEVVVTKEESAAPPLEVASHLTPSVGVETNEAKSAVMPVTPLPAETASVAVDSVPIDDEKAAAKKHFDLGTSYLQQNLPQEATKAFRTAIALYPEYAEAFYNLGTIAASKKKLDKALVYLEQAVVLKPDYTEALYNLGYVYYQQGDKENATAVFKKFTEVAKDIPAEKDRVANVQKVLNKWGAK